MEASRNLAKAAVVTAALVWAPWVLWEVLKAYVLGRGDWKLGAEGGVLFVAAIWGAMALVSAITVSAVHLTWQTARGPIGTRAFWGSTLGGGIVLAVISRFLFSLPPIGSAVFGDIGAIVATWLIICVIVQSAGVAIASSIAI